MTRFLLFFIAFITVIKANSQELQQKAVLWLDAFTPITQSGLWINKADSTQPAIFSTIGSLPGQELINYNPANLFDAQTADLKFEFESNGNKYVTFIVYHGQSKANEYGLIGLTHDSILYHLSTQRFGKISTEAVYADTTSLEPQLNVLSFKFGKNSVDSLNAIFGGKDSTKLNGKIAEILVFNKQLKAREREKIQTYLAIRYGITLTSSKYVIANDSVLWDTKRDSMFNHEVAAIGKDTLLQINQKQSAGKGGLSIVSIAANSHMATNEFNTEDINQGDFIIWGNNNVPLNQTRYEEVNIDSGYLVSNQLWQIKVHGTNQIRNTSTQLILNAIAWHAYSDFFIQINRTPNDSLENWITIHADSVDANFLVYFNNVKWDLDSSGVDLFRFGFTGMPNNFLEDENSANNQTDAKERGLNMEVFPNPSNGQFSVNITSKEAYEGVIRITDFHGKLITSIEVNNGSGQTQQNFELAQGNFLVSLITADKVITKKLFIYR